MNSKPYIRSVSRYSWWLSQGLYLRYMAREITSLFIGAYTAVLVVGLARLAEGRAAWDAALEARQSPLSVAFHLVALLFALYHSATWFNLTPKAMPLEVAGRRLPGVAIVSAHYAAWVMISAALLVLAGG